MCHVFVTAQFQSRRADRCIGYHQCVELVGRKVYGGPCIVAGRGKPALRSLISGRHAKVLISSRLYYRIYDLAQPYSKALLYEACLGELYSVLFTYLPPFPLFPSLFFAFSSTTMSPSTQEFHLQTLSTNSITFSPFGATIQREVQVPTQPGLNEITVSGLDPRVETDSIRVSAQHGLATITNVQTSTVQRAKDEVPEKSTITTDNDNQPTKTEDEEEKCPEKTKISTLTNTLEEAQSFLITAQHRSASSRSQMQALDTYLRALNPKNVGFSGLDEFLRLYGRVGREESERLVRAERMIGESQKDIERLSREKESVGRSLRRKNEMANEELMMRRATERKYWTKHVGTVTISLDRDGNDTNSDSSRFGPTRSVVGESKSESGDHSGQSTKKKVDGGNGIVTIQLIYVLPSTLASWTPRYDLSITTTPLASTRLVYRAEFKNESTETWLDARVSFSHSQAAFSKLDERILSLPPWLVSLRPCGKADNVDDCLKGIMKWSSVLLSNDETRARMDEARDLQFAKEKVKYQKKVARSRFRQEQEQQSQPSGLFGNPTLAGQPSTTGQGGTESL